MFCTQATLARSDVGFELMVDRLPLVFQNTSLLYLDFTVLTYEHGCSFIPRRKAGATDPQRRYGEWEWVGEHVWRDFAPFCDRWRDLNKNS